MVARIQAAREGLSRSNWRYVDLERAEFAALGYVAVGEYTEAIIRARTVLTVCGAMPMAVSRTRVHPFGRLIDWLTRRASS